MVHPRYLWSRWLVRSFQVAFQVNLATFSILAGLVELEPAPAPPDNPLKGFMPYSGAYATFPHSLEWTYLHLSEVQSGYNEFRWSYLDGLLNQIAGRGHQAIFRTFLDYPNLGYGVPGFLSHVPKRSYTDHGNGVRGTSYSPDYSHPDLRRAMTNYIAALGARYDGDPRIGFITIGMLGFWGEWHTFPYNGFDGKPDWFAPVAVQKEILDAFTQAFPRTKLLVREPKDGLDFRKWAVGYHDDSFAFSTLAPVPWHFWPRITSKGLESIWKTQPIGGEVRPEIQGCMWLEGAACVPAGQGYEQSVATTHASWMLNQGAFNGRLSGDALGRAIEGARQLGYELRVLAAEFPQRAGVDRFSVGVTMTNAGVAPFYYPWPVRLGIRSGTGTMRQWTNSWNLTEVMPGRGSSRFTANVAVDGLGAGDYQLMLNVPNPLPNGHPLRFGNRNQDLTLPGWLTLGDIRIGSPPRVESVSLSGQQIHVEFGSLVAGWRYVVESKEVGSSTETGWTVTESWTATEDRAAWTHDLNGAESGRFYRLAEER
jgi:hypothetical protein